MKADGIRPGAKTIPSTVSWKKKPAISVAGQNMLKALTQKGLEIVIPKTLEVYTSEDFLGFTGFASPAAWYPDHPFTDMAETTRQTFERELQLAKRDEINAMLAKGEVLIALDSYWCNSIRPQFSRLPELLTELQPSSIQLVVEKTDITWEKQTTFVGLKIKLHPAQIRAILPASEEKDVTPAESLFRHISASLQRALDKFQGDYRYSIGGGRSVLHFEGFSLNREIAQLELQLMTRTTRIELDGAPDHYEEHSFAKWLLKQLWQTWRKPTSLTNNEFAVRVPEDEKIAYASFAGIPVKVSYCSTKMGFLGQARQNPLEGLALPGMVPKDKLN